MQPRHGGSAVAPPARGGRGRRPPLRTSNVDELELRFWKLTPETAASLLLLPWEKRVGPGAPLVQAFKTGAGKNTVKTQPLSVRSLLGGARTGLYLLEVRGS